MVFNETLFSVHLFRLLDEVSCRGSCPESGQQGTECQEGYVGNLSLFQFLLWGKLTRYLNSGLADLIPIAVNSITCRF
jgi:hypothetical protein